MSTNSRCDLAVQTNSAMQSDREIGINVTSNDFDMGFAVETSSDTAEIRPSRSSVTGLIVTNGTLAGFWTFFAILIYNAIDHEISWCFALLNGCFVAVYVMIAIRGWSRRGIALIVETNGRVSCDSQELIPPGTAKQIIIEERAMSECSSDFLLFIEQTDGTRIRLPDPYFGEFDEVRQAVSLAMMLGKMLHVPVISAASAGEVVTLTEK